MSSKEISKTADEVKTMLDLVEEFIKEDAKHPKNQAWQAKFKAQLEKVYDVAWTDL